MQFNYYDKKFKMQQFSLKNNRKICKLNQWLEKIYICLQCQRKRIKNLSLFPFLIKFMLKFFFFLNWGK